MGERADGRWASKFVGMSVPRQNGKSQLIVARALAGVLLFGEKTIIISAHETDTAREIWKRMIDLVEENPSLEARVTGRMNAVNREFLTFGKGLEKQTIKLKARSQTGSRGFSADCLLLDEAQILGKRAWGAIVPTMSARPNPQLWLFGTPPTTEDDPFAFERTRDSAQRGKARHCWLEWSAEQTDDFDDPETWAKANPSYGIRVSHEACADDRNALDNTQFAQERLGIWLDEEVTSPSKIPLDVWSPLAVNPGESRIVSDVVFAVDVSPDRGHSSIGVAGVTDLGRLQVEVVADGDGVTWVGSAITELALAWKPLAVVLDQVSAAAALETTLQAEGIEPLMTNSTEMTQACGGFYDDAASGVLAHLDDPVLNAALQGAETRELVGAWAWKRRSKVSITPLVAVTLARYGFEKVYRPPTRKGSGPKREPAPAGERATRTDDLASAGF